MTDYLAMFGALNDLPSLTREANAMMRSISPPSPRSDIDVSEPANERGEGFNSVPFVNQQTGD